MSKGLLLLGPWLLGLAGAVGQSHGLTVPTPLSPNAEDPQPQVDCTDGYRPCGETCCGPREVCCSGGAGEPSFCGTGRCPGGV